MKQLCLFLSVIFAVMILAACQTTPTQTASAAEPTGEVEAASDAEILARERELNQREFELAKREKAQQGNNASAAAPVDAAGELYPPNARPGECYARLLIPAEYRTVTEKVLKREASERIEIVPASYKKVTKRVLVKPETTQLVTVPAKYGTKTERIQVSPAQIVDRFGNTQNILGTKVTYTGELLCLVEVPAQYKTVSKTVLVSPATTKTVTTPAEYKTVEVTELVSAAQEKRVAIPEEYGTVTRTELVRAEQLTWAPVLCQVNMTSQNVTRLQSALKKQGCYVCEVDGIMGECTFRGAQCYAKRKGLASGSNFVTIETIRSLGLQL